MDLTIRYDSTAKMLRSTDEPPGILVVVYPGDAPASFAVSGKFSPDRLPMPDEGEAVVSADTGPLGTFEDAAERDEITTVDTDDVLDGCAGHRELRVVWFMAYSTWLHLSESSAPIGQLDIVEDGLRFLIEVRDGIGRRQ